jgi:hypothetical protein
MKHISDFHLYSQNKIQEKDMLNLNKIKSYKPCNEKNETCLMKTFVFDHEYIFCSKNNYNSFFIL